MTVDTVSDPLGYAASLLDAVGADREQVPADIALECLYAAELLELAGGRAEPVPLIDGDPAASIRAAMGALGLLDERTFASTPVLDAARAARRHPPVPPPRPPRPPRPATAGLSGGHHPAAAARRPHRPSRRPPRGGD